MHLQHTLKELVPLGFIVGKATLSQVNGLGNTTCEVHQRIRRVASIQGLVTARQPGEQCGKNSPLMLPNLKPSPYRGDLGDSERSSKLRSHSRSQQSQH